MTDPADQRTAWALFFLSLGITAHQIAIMQILSLVQWYHFAYMVVALALLGFGASGSFFALFRKRLLENYHTLLPLLMLGCGLTLAASPFFLKPLGFDLYLLFVEPGQIIRLIVASLLFCVPFFLGGLAIALALTRGVGQSGFLYCANLIGSSGGGFIGLWLTDILLPVQLPFVIGLFPVLAGIILLSGVRFLKKMFLAAAAGVCFTCLYLLVPDLAPSQYKDVSRVLNLPDAEVVVQEPDPSGLLQVITAPALRLAPGLSFSFQGEIPRSAAVMVNGDAYGAIALDADRTAALNEYTTEVLGYLLTRPESVLLLQSGGTASLSQALERRAREITVVEPHGEMHRLLAKGIGGRAASGAHPRVVLLHAEPRAFLETTGESYDLIRFPTIGALGGNVGLFALSEQFLLTRESFGLAWQRLSPAGVLMISTWMDYPVKNPLKLLATLVETCRGGGGGRF